jgi:7,8-dihydroneopterin aldolase/epimerase/oxygenase
MEVSMSFNAPQQRWTIHVRDLRVALPIGIYEHELVPQNIVVNAQIEGMFPVQPQTIEDCFNYEHVHTLVVKHWPTQPHTPLLETRVVQLLAHIFAADARVTRASVSIAKPDIFPEAASVGVEAEWTRTDYERYAALG